MSPWPDPLGSASALIQVHATAAILALLIGAIVLTRRKGTLGHRRLGWAWIALMGLAAGTAVFLGEGSGLMIGSLGPLGPVHLLIILTLNGMWQGVRAIRRGDVAAHRSNMRITFVAALIVAGAFTLLPGRRMSATLLGGMGPLAAWAALGALLLLAAGLLAFWKRADRRQPARRTP